jgi:site-specific DNA-methyltransferase (adenine-specific)
MPEQVYEAPKKSLQLEVRRVARLIGRLPSRDDMIANGRYPIRYYDAYFTSWGEVCAAARHDGMTEEKVAAPKAELAARQPSLFDDNRAMSS